MTCRERTREGTPKGTPKHKGKAPKDPAQRAKHTAQQDGTAEPSGSRTADAAVRDAERSGQDAASAPEATTSEAGSKPNRSLRPGGKPRVSGGSHATSAAEATAQHATEDAAAGGDYETLEPEEDEEAEKQKVYVINPEFPRLPSSVPLTYTLTMVACLCSNPDERPTFAQVQRSTTPAGFFYLTSNK